MIRTLNNKGVRFGQLQRSDEELADRVAQAQPASLRREGDLHLRNAAAACVGDDVLQEDATGQGAERRRRQRPADPRVSRGGHGPVDEQVLGEGDGHVEGHGGQAAEDAGDEREDEEALRLGRREVDLGA